MSTFHHRPAYPQKVIYLFKDVPIPHYEYHAEVAKRYPPGQQKKMYKGNGKKKKW